MRDTPHKENPVKNPLAGKLEAPKTFIADVQKVRKDRKETREIVKELKEALEKVAADASA